MDRGMHTRKDTTLLTATVASQLVCPSLCRATGRQLPPAERFCHNRTANITATYGPLADVNFKERGTTAVNAFVTNVYTNI